MFLDKKTVLQIWLNPGLNLTIFQVRGEIDEQSFAGVLLFSVGGM